MVNKVQEEVPLTKEEKLLIWKTIWKNMAPDDRDPCEVIKDMFGRDEEAYLRVMAKQHGILLGQSQNPN